MKRVAALVPNIRGGSPGQRVRIETWSEQLELQGWAVDLYPFEDARLREVIYERGRRAAKAYHLLRCYGAQFERVRRLPPYDVVFVYQEAALLGPAFLERLAQRRGAPLVYDLDDPRFVRYRSPTSGFASALKFAGKTNSLLRRADQVIAINPLLADHARRYNPAVTVVPNSVDIDHYRPAPTAPGPARLVWIGSHSSAPSLTEIAPALQRLQAGRGTPVRLIGADASALPGVAVETRSWSTATEVRDLQECHIGIVPIADIPWNRWKFYYKTIQYMAVGLPVVARPLGSNSDVIEHGVNGFLAESQDEWYDALRMLVDDPALRARMGAAARATVLERFTLSAHAATVASVFDQAATRYGALLSAR